MIQNRLTKIDGLCLLHVLPVPAARRRQVAGVDSIYRPPPSNNGHILFITRHNKVSPGLSAQFAPLPVWMSSSPAVSSNCQPFKFEKSRVLAAALVVRAGGGTPAEAFPGLRWAVGAETHSGDRPGTCYSGQRNFAIVFTTFREGSCQGGLIGVLNKQPLLCSLPLWVVELGLVAGSCHWVVELYKYR